MRGRSTVVREVDEGHAVATRQRVWVEVPTPTSGIFYFILWYMLFWCIFCRYLNIVSKLGLDKYLDSKSAHSSI